MRPCHPCRLVQLRLGEPEAALAVFKKLHGLLPDSPEVLQQLAACCEAADDLEAAVQWLEVAASVVPNDAGVMVRLGALHARWVTAGGVLTWRLRLHQHCDCGWHLDPVVVKDSHSTRRSSVIGPACCKLVMRRKQHHSRTQAMPTH